MSQKVNCYKEVCSEKTLQSNSKGFFMNFVDMVVEHVGEDWIKNDFGKLKTDEDRIRCVFESKQTKDIVTSFLSNVKEVYRGKDADFSKKRRQEAEMLLEKNEIDKALLLFSQSVLRASKTGENKTVDSGFTLPLALLGRAQALIKKQTFSVALSDLQFALQETIPEKCKAQTYQSLGICYKSLGVAKKAIIAFNLCQKLVEGDTEKLKELKRVRNLEYKEEYVKKSVNKVNPTLAGHPNPSLRNASSKLKSQRSNDMGRFIVAGEKISTGDTLVVEPPYAACLLPECFGTHCQECFERLENAIPCPDCSSLAFCSTKCRTHAISTYHKYECRYLNLLIGSGMSVLAHTALRMVTQNKLERCLEIYGNKNKEKVYSLCSNAHLRLPHDFFQRTLMACFLLRCLQKAGYFGNIGNRIQPNKEEYQIGAMLLFNLQMLQFNAHEIYETRHGPQHRIRDSKTAYIGVAVYLTASLFNHDCFLALTRYFVGKNIILQATRPLQPNEIVPENYGPVFTRKSLNDRKLSLSGRYWFDCQCKACCENWPGYHNGLDKVSARLKCPTENCPKNVTTPLSNPILTCPQCKKCVKLTERVEKLDRCVEKYYEAFAVMDQGDSQKASQILCEAIDEFYSIALPPHKETQLAEEMLRACAADMGNTSATLQLLQEKS